VRAEGGSGKHPEYVKTQALITRTYMEKYLDKHITDGYNLCDNTHCQVFQGITDDTLIMNAALGTRGEIITGPDSLPIIAAFHSNCGGETSPSEFVWLTPQPYLVKVTDPFCLSSRNTTWEKSYLLSEWTEFLRKEGMVQNNGGPAIFAFSQKTRTTDYAAGDFSLPLSKVRDDLGLRSTFFSVTVDGDSVLLKGRGYGHGVGLCQEGAMVMASKGFTYKQIIAFYYSGVTIRRVEE
jgi:stage II sporulation protein D